jgi:hypothetical protein
MKSDQAKAERLRVLKMLEEGKINAEECAELLAALDEPQPCTPKKMTRVQRAWAATGAVLVLIGFLLPWVIIDVNLFEGKAVGAIDPTLNVRPYAPVIDLRLTGSGFEGGPLLRWTGGEMRHGLGWLVLACALGAALIPHWKPGLFLLAMGAAMIGYLLVMEMGRPCSIGLGLLLVVPGYLIEAVALLNERLWRQK